MKSILVPTDFSACAGFATNFAIEFAERFEGKVHLYTCLDLPYNWHTMTGEEKNTNVEATQKVKNAETLMRDIKNQHPNTPISFAISGGNLIQNITDYLAKHDIDLVIMGSHGASGLNELFIGSNTQRVVRFAKIPVLIIKDKIKNFQFEKVVFASSFNADEQAPFLKFKSLIEPFQPEVHLVAIHTSSFFDAPYVLQMEVLDDFKALATPLNCKTHIFRNFSVEKGIRFFADQIGADLIVISNHHHHPLKRMLIGSNVEALVNHAEVPVLAIDFSSK